MSKKIQSNTLSLLSFSRIKIRYYAPLIISLIFLSSFSIVLSILVMKGIDVTLSSSSTSSLVTVALLLIFACFIYMCMLYINEVVGEKITTSIAMKHKALLLENYLKMEKNT